MTDGVREQLQAALGDSYTLERELGAGGFARVFVARERALDRRVAVKVLSPDLAASLSAQRFQREIRLAASLQQANIVPVLAAGDADGLPFYTMPFVAGLSLRERLERGRLQLHHTVAILRDVARALAYAHEQGVVHRDIKPENILLSGDAAVVTDFGIAKAISSAQQGESGALRRTTLTQPGLALGTPAYMAPEQIAGDPAVDHRADVYALGCVAYELLTGEPPFAGSFQALLSAHIATMPVPVAARRPDCPPPLARLVMQCLAKEAAARPQSARDVLRVLDSELVPASGMARWRQRLSMRQQRSIGAALLLVALGSAAVVWQARDASDAVPLSTIAVLPFVNLSGDSTEEYLADGIADELATSLGRLRGVRVVARGLSYRFKGRRDVDAEEVARVLDAELFVHGSVRRVANGLRVSAQLMSTHSKNELWSNSYLREVRDALAFQDSITRAITLALGRQLRGDSLGLAVSVASSPSVDPEAYDLYLRGRFLLLRRGVGVRQSIEKFEQAIARDSTFARAHAALALALQLLPYFDSVQPDSLRQPTLEAIEAALRRDSTLAEAHTAHAMVRQHAWEWTLADSAYQRALAFDSTTADAYIQYGRFQFYMGRFAEAERLFARARAVDPHSAVASGWHGHMQVLRGNLRAGMREIQRALEIDSTVPPTLVFAMQAAALAGRKAEARRYAERLWRTYPGWRVPAAVGMGDMGDPEPARQMLDSIRRTPAPWRHTNTMRLLLTLDDTVAALDAFERAVAAREIWPTVYSMSEPDFDPLRQHPRFAAILRSAGLDVATFTSPTGGRPR